jgi:hypothetical protein
VPQGRRATTQQPRTLRRSSPSWASRARTGGEVPRSTRRQAPHIPAGRRTGAASRPAAMSPMRWSVAAGPFACCIRRFSHVAPPNWSNLELVRARNRWTRAGGSKDLGGALACRHAAAAVRRRLAETVGRAAGVMQHKGHFRDPPPGSAGLIRCEGPTGRARRQLPRQSHLVSCQHRLRFRPRLCSNAAPDTRARAGGLRRPGEIPHGIPSHANNGLRSLISFLPFRRWPLRSGRSRRDE